MEKCMKVFMVIICFLLLTGTVNAQHLSTDVAVLYNSIYYPEFYKNLSGGTEGHSGAYVTIYAGIEGYNEISPVSAKAKHMASDFEVSLVAEDSSCPPWPPPLSHIDLYLYTRLQPKDWMTGEWEITLKYTDGDQKNVIENATVIVPQFNFPPPPTGLQIAESEGKTWLVWNRIADPQNGGDSYKRYSPVIKHFTPFPYCIDEFHRIAPGGTTPYQLWSGNRIAVEIPSNWKSGDLLRVENRLYDLVDGVRRMDRGIKLFFLP
jgi:hypothetical protein